MKHRVPGEAVVHKLPEVITFPDGLLEKLKITKKEAV